jgi:hypothetical protein
MNYDDIGSALQSDAAATTFADIQQILDDAVNGQEIGAHLRFWRNTTRNEFVVKKVFGCQIITRDGAGRFIGSLSPLVTILRGPIECPPTRMRPQMPVGFAPMPAERIQIISDWIDAQCPP